MAERITRQLVAERAIIHEAPLWMDRNFELPTGLYVAMAGLLVAAVGVLAFGFAAPGLVVPMGIIAIFMTMFFAVPAQWVRMKPANASRATSWSRFRQHGIVTPYGRSTAGAATVQVLILPALILIWAVAVVTIAALVR